MLEMLLCSIVNSNPCRTHTVKARPLLIRTEKLMILDIIKKFLGFNVAKNSQCTEETRFYKFTLLCLDKLRECGFEKKKTFLIKNT